MMDDKKLMRIYAKLTVRKQEIVELVSQGYSNGAIADALYISVASVAGHLTEIFGELSAYEELIGVKPNRQLVTSLFAPFFDRHPEMKQSNGEAL